ncbi:MAG TPA: alpha/beta fold hydrolase, partial [Ruania sp.]|nr:alpha/beta fold hydrolase [Ruania sp.]
MSRTRLAAAAAIAGLLILLGGCAASAPMTQPAEAAPSFPEELQEYYTQDLSWSECGDGYRCTEVTVPMDYDEPDGETISIALKVLEASGESHGPLLVNPGGPGGSGLELVENAQSMFGAPLLENFDLVGFDPRGVGESTAVRCYDSDQLDEFYSQDYDMTTDGGFDAFEQDMQAFGQACEQNTGELVHHLDTVSAARDMDVLRGVLGQQQLSYLGFSYGTYLGATYADLFPQNVGRFVLDGAIDPALSYAEVTRGQVEGFDKAYRAYLADCLDNADCP